MLLAILQGGIVNQARHDGVTPLFIASQAGHVDVVSACCWPSRASDVNQAKNDGATPLFIASQEGHAEVVSMLLAKQVRRREPGHE